MRCRTLFFAFAITLIYIAGPASAARIIVTIDGLHSAQGNVFVGLYATPSKFLNGNQSDAMRKVRASTGPITVAFDNLPPGTYAVGAYHDENGNDHLDTNFLGLIIPGRPRVGQRFQAENVPGITKEDDEIVSVTSAVKLAIGTFANAVKIKESYPDGSVEYKYYVPSVGTVTEIAPDGTVNLRQHSSCWQLGTPSDPDALIRP